MSKSKPSNVKVKIKVKVSMSIVLRSSLWVVWILAVTYVLLAHGHNIHIYLAARTDPDSWEVVCRSICKSS